MAQFALVPSSGAADDELRIVARQMLFFLLSDGKGNVSDITWMKSANGLSWTASTTTTLVSGIPTWWVTPEYTPAAFAIAVSASWWAVRVGKAKLRVPRMPAFFCHGRRDRVFREWAISHRWLSHPLTALRRLGYRP